MARTARSVRRARRVGRKGVGWLGLAALVAILLAGCGSGATAAGGTATPTATTVALGTEPPQATATPGPTPPPPPTLPYSFPTSWKPVAGLPDGVLGFAFAPSNPRTGYACTGQIGSTTEPAFYMTSDGGATWQATTARMSEPTGCQLWVDASNPQDVFLQQLSSNPGGTNMTHMLLRSLDGGRTWKGLAPITLQQMQVGVQNLAVIGSRIIVSASIFGEGLLPNDLVKSDDGGSTWQQLAQSVASQHLVVANFSDAGGTLFLEADTPCTGCGTAAPLFPARHGRTARSAGSALALPLSSQPPGPATFWKSTDAGNTWTKVTNIPGSLPAFAAQSCCGIYAGLSIAVPSPTAPAQYYITNNAGDTWQQSANLSGLEHGYVDATGSPATGLVTVGADGTLVTDTWHDANGPNGGNDAGYFYFPGGGSSASEWMALAPPGTQNVALISGGANSHGRLWGIGQTTAGGSALVYVDLP